MNMTKWSGRRAALLGLVSLGLALAGCGRLMVPAQSRGVYLLIDTSGSYARELPKVRQVLAALLLYLRGGDSLAVARIDRASFTQEAYLTRVTFDQRQSEATRQKAAVNLQLTNALKNIDPGPYADITGALLQAIQDLREKNPQKKEILIFSDLEQQLPKGVVRKGLTLDFTGIEVIALNATKSGRDNRDPRVYFERLNSWRSLVEQHGGRWRVINDIGRLQERL